MEYITEDALSPDRMSTKLAIHHQVGLALVPWPLLFGRRVYLLSLWREKSCQCAVIVNEAIALEGTFYAAWEQKMSVCVATCVHLRALYAPTSRVDQVIAQSLLLAGSCVSTCC